MVDRNGHNDPEEVHRIYGRLARSYDTLDAWGRPLFFRKGYLALDRAFQAQLPPNGRILDLGCGTGLNVDRLQGLKLSFSSYLGIDFSKEMLEKARAKFGNLEHIRFKQMDLSKEALPEGPVDLIISTWVFEHLTDPASVVDRAWQRLVPGGHMVLLFMVKKGWVNFCTAPILRLSNTRISYGAEENVYRRFPGMVSLDHLAGGSAVLTILHKPAEPTTGEGVELANGPSTRGGSHENSQR